MGWFRVAWATTTPMIQFMRWLSYLESVVSHRGGLFLSGAAKARVSLLSALRFVRGRTPHGYRPSMQSKWSLHLAIKTVLPLASFLGHRTVVWSRVWLCAFGQWQQPSPRHVVLLVAVMQSGLTDFHYFRLTWLNTLWLMLCDNVYIINE